MTVKEKIKGILKKYDKIQIVREYQSPLGTQYIIDFLANDIQYTIFSQTIKKCKCLCNVKRLI